MTSIDILRELNVISASDAKERELLYTAACSSLNLSTTDFQTVRDLVRHTSEEYPDRNHLPLEAALIAMFAAVNRGDLCLDLSPLPEGEKRFPDMDKESCIVFEEQLKGFVPDQYDRLVCRLDINDHHSDESNCKQLLSQFLRHVAIHSSFQAFLLAYIF